MKLTAAQNSASDIVRLRRLVATGLGIAEAFAAYMGKDIRKGGAIETFIHDAKKELRIE